MSITKLQEKDIEQVVRLEESVFTHPWKKDAIEKMRTDKNYCFLVAKFGDEVVGNCALRKILDEGEITNVSVKKEARKQGIARKMFARLIEEGNKMGVNEYTLEVRTKNYAAIALYEEFEFSKEGRRKDFYTDPKDDAWIMWKRKELCEN